jgi:hypothetical protein
MISMSQQLEGGRFVQTNMPPDLFRPVVMLLSCLKKGKHYAPSSAALNAIYGKTYIVADSEML